MKKAIISPEWIVYITPRNSLKVFTIPYHEGIKFLQHNIKVTYALLCVFRECTINLLLKIIYQLNEVLSEWYESFFINQLGNFIPNRGF